MLRPQAVGAYDTVLNSVVSDLLAKLRLRSSQNGQGLVTDIANEFYRFGLEGEWTSPRLPCFYGHVGFRTSSNL